MGSKVVMICPRMNKLQGKSWQLQALKQLKNDKTPGSDGFTMEFRNTVRGSSHVMLWPFLNNFMIIVGLKNLFPKKVNT